MSGVLDGKVAIVTGAARGIGKAIAERFAAQAAKVVLVDNGSSIDGREHERGLVGSVAAGIGETACALERDIGTPDAAREAVQLARETFGGIDIVVNNAAILRDAMVFKGDPADFDSVLRTNLSAAYYMINAAGPVLRMQAGEGRTGGRILSIVSSAGFYGNFGVAAYASAKAGLMGLTRVCALELARTCVTANALMPFAATRVTETIPPVNYMLKQYRERALKIPAESVAVVASWICSELAQQISGQLLGVRGREVFLMSQPRPVETVTAAPAGWTEQALSEAAEKIFDQRFVELRTDVDIFNTDPVI